MSSIHTASVQPADKLRVESELRRANRALRTLSSCNQALVHATTEMELLAQICRVIVEAGGYRLAWVGYVEHDEKKTVRAVASSGYEEGYLAKLNITWADEPHGHGPTGTAIRTARAAVCRDMLSDPQFLPWRDEAVKRGYASSIVLPLLGGSVVFGAVSIYAIEPDSFAPEEEKLLKELADDLAYGVLALRTREEHKAAARELRQNEERFRLIVEASPDGICVVDREGLIRLVNSRMTSLLGYDGDELVGQPLEMLLPARLKEGHVPLRRAFQAKPKVRRMGDNACYPARRKDNSEVPVQISLHPIEMPDGPMTLTILKDVSEELRTGEALRHNEALFQSLITTIPDHIYFKDRGGKFIRINELMARDLGLRNASEAFGKTDFELFDQAHADQAAADDQRVMTSGESIIGIEEKKILPGGRMLWVSTTKVPLRDPEGRVAGLVGISRDITQRKELEARFLQSQKMEAFGQLAGGIAHDFNNILAAMMMQLSLAEMEPGLSAASLSWLKELERSAQRATSLTRQMLLFSRRQAMETRLVDLNEVLEGLCKMLRRLVGEHIAFEWKKAVAPMWVEADSGMIEQIVMNLCVNARDAMPEGGRLVVEARLEERAGSPGGDVARAGRFVCIAVSDTGCGMDEATQKRIFEPFFTTKAPGEGTGLGLATVYGIVKQHRGWVEVDSAPGKGSTFRVHFQYREPDSPPELAMPAAQVRGGSERILLVEDEEALRMSMAMRLRHAGYWVAAVKNGAEAAKAWDVHRGAFDLLATDILMPGGMTGLQLAQQLTRAKPTLKVIALTGHYVGAENDTLPPNLTRLTKPVPAEALLECVRRLLDPK